MTKIILSKATLKVLVTHAKKGYESPYKREVGGHLFGYSTKDGFYVGKAIPYNTLYSSRSEWSPNQISFANKGKTLEKNQRLKWVGEYHSHNEISGRASTTLSTDDKKILRDALCTTLIIIRVSVYPMNWPRLCSSYQYDNYYYDICGYVKDKKDKIKMVRVISLRKE